MLPLRVDFVVANMSEFKTFKTIFFFPNSNNN